MEPNNKKRDLKMKVLDCITFVLLVIGGLNWLLIGVIDVDLVEAIFGAGTLITRVIYILVGLSAIYQILQWNCMRSRWSCNK